MAGAGPTGRGGVVSEPEVVWVGDQWVPVRAEVAQPAGAARGAAGGGKRDRVVAVRLFAAELAAWQEAAKGGGRREVGRWVRESMNTAIAQGDDPAVGVASRVSRPGVELAALARIGNNLNQAMRYAHTQVGDAVIAQELVDAVNRASAELRALREAL